MSTLGPHFEYRVRRKDGKPIQSREEGRISGIIEEVLHRGVCASLVIDGKYRFNTLWPYNRERSPDIRRLKEELLRRGYALGVVGGNDL